MSTETLRMIHEGTTTDLGFHSCSTIHYHRCVRFLLYPQLSQTPVNHDYVQTCAKACQGIIGDYRSLHRKFPVGFSALSIQSVFLSGGCSGP